MTDKPVLDRLETLEQVVMSLGTMLALHMEKFSLLEQAFASVCHDNEELELALFAKNAPSSGSN